MDKILSIVEADTGIALLELCLDNVSLLLLTGVTNSEGLPSALEEVPSKPASWLPLMN